MGLIDKLHQLGDSIRSKTGKQSLLTLDEMINEINSLNQTDKFSLFITDRLESIQASDWSNCSEIPKQCCYLKSSLHDVEIANTVEIIQSYAFAHSGVKYLTFENGSKLNSIGQGVFEGCSNLDHVDFPNTLTKIDTYAFSSCTALSSITLPNSVTNLGTTDYAGDSGYVFSNCTNLKNVVLSNSLKVIPTGCFSGCSSLESITIPATVTRLEGSAFSSCTSLREFIFEEGSRLNSIGWGCISSSNLTYIELPESLQYIYSMSSLDIGSENNRATLRLRSKTPPHLSYTSYQTSYIETIIVPEGCGEAYRSATNWSIFADHIVEATE